MNIGSGRLCFFTTNELLNSVIEAEAWKEVVSRNEVFSMDILEKFADKVDWSEVTRAWGRVASGESVVEPWRRLVRKTEIRRVGKQILDLVA